MSESLSEAVRNQKEQERESWLESHPELCWNCAHHKDQHDRNGMCRFEDCRCKDLQ